MKIQAITPTLGLASPALPLAICSPPIPAGAPISFGTRQWHTGGLEFLRIKLPLPYLGLMLAWLAPVERVWAQIPSMSSASYNASASGRTFKQSAGEPAHTDEPGPSTGRPAKALKRRPSASMVVQMYNASDAPVFEVAKAERVTSGLFSNAGIKINWTNCPLPPGPTCQSSSDPRLFILAIVGVAPSTIPETAMGYAAPFSGLANRAAVVYPRVIAHSRQNPEVLMGVLIAHELAHLILHTNSHGQGILRQVWTGNDVMVAALLRLSFTKEQARDLRRGLNDRRPDMVAARKGKAN